MYLYMEDINLMNDEKLQEIIAYDEQYYMPVFGKRVPLVVDHGKGAYRVATHNKGKASQCVGCGQCEHVCPQHLPIIDLLKTCTELE